MHLRVAGLLAVIGLVWTGITVGCTSGGAPSTGPTGAPSEVADVPLAARTVWAGTYSHDVQPIFDQYCTSCHGPSRAENGLRLDSYENTMRGTQFGPVVVPGAASASTLAAVVQGTADPKIRMPHEGRKLTRNRIQNILLWIEAGAPND